MSERNHMDDRLSNDRSEGRIEQENDSDASDDPFFPGTEGTEELKNDTIQEEKPKKPPQNLEKSPVPKQKNLEKNKTSSFRRSGARRN